MITPEQIAACTDPAFASFFPDGASDWRAVFTHPACDRINRQLVAIPQPPPARRKRLTTFNHDPKGECT